MSINFRLCSTHTEHHCKNVANNNSVYDCDLCMESSNSVIK